MTIKPGIARALLLAVMAASMGCQIGTPGDEVTSATIKSTDTVNGSSTAAAATTGPSDLTSTSPSGEGTTGYGTTGSTASSGGSTSIAAETDTTGLAPPACPLALGNVYDGYGFANAGSEAVTALAVSSTKGRLVALFHSSACPGGNSLGFGEGPLPLPGDSDDLILGQYDLGLDYVESHLFGGPGNTKGEALAIDANGNIYVVGYFDTAVDIPFELGKEGVADHFLAPPGSYASFIAVFSPDGNKIWSTTVESQSGDTFLYAVAVAGNGDFAVAGSYSGVLDPNPDGCPLVLPPASSLLIRAYDASFTPRPMQCPSNLAGPSDVLGRFFGIATSEDGSVIAGGDFAGTLALGDPNDETTHISSLTNYDAVAVGWDSQGKYAWHTVCASETNDQVYDVAVGPDNRVIMVGRIGDKQKCSDTELHPGSVESRAFVAAFDPHEPVSPWIFDRTLIIPDEPVEGEEVHSQFYAVSVAPCGEIVTAGFALKETSWEDAGGLDFAGVAPMAFKDIIVARLTAEGATVWERRYQSEGGDVALGVTTDLQGSVYMGGSYEGVLVGGGQGPWPLKEMGDCDERNGNAFVLHVSP